MLFEFKFCLFHGNQSFIYLFFGLRQFYYFINRSSDTNIFTTNEAMYCDFVQIQVVLVANHVKVVSIQSLFFISIFVKRL